MINANNNVQIAGKIIGGFTFAREIFGEKIYDAKISVTRKSGITDVLPISVSGKLLEGRKGEYAKVSGQYRSYNMHDGNKTRLILSIFADDIVFSDNDFEDENHVHLEGFICKPPLHRECSSGRRITDMMVAVQRTYRRSDYIPCIAWGREAVYASKLPVGEKIVIDGRIQSRPYSKRLGSGEVENKIAYEVSVGKVSIAAEMEE